VASLSISGLDKHIKISLYAYMSQLLAILKACADPSRLRLLALLQGAELTVKHVTQILKQSQPRVSRHLKVLADAGLIERHKEGAWVFFRLVRDPDRRALLEPILERARSEPGLTERDTERLIALKQNLSAAADSYFAAQAEAWDQVRSLHVAEAEVEAAVRDAFSGKRYRMLLDIGTGTGRMLEVLAGLADQALGLDLNRAMLKNARSRLDAAGLNHCQVREGDMYALPLSDQTVDAVIIHQVLHFSTTPEDAVREAARVLASGGRLVIVDFAPHAHEDLRSIHAHQRLGFSNDQINEWVTSAGLSAGPPASLTGGALTVMVWQANKRAHALSEAA
jgi:ubiquinone/menaquinone biosynthesis C-methylase UbiE/DNA-binding transcriptional ArsR family regulator